MQATLTLKVKLEITPDVAASLAETQAAYVMALNQTSAVAFEKQVFNAVALHHITYRDVRALTELPANLVCSARAVVAEAYKRDAKKHHRWKPMAAMRYDARTLTVKLPQACATLTTLQGRVRMNLILSDYHRQYLDESWKIKPTAAVIRKGRIWYLHLIATKEVPDAEGSEVLGVDGGINRIATTSTAKAFKGGTIKQIRRRRFKQRRSLQSEGHKTRAQRRLLKHLSGKEHRAVEWRLWNVANGMVREAVKINAGVIALENLKHLRARVCVAKKQRLILHGWPFSSLALKITHVASKRGIRVVEVDARNTSRMCNRCGHCEKANRKNQSEFRCVKCLHTLNADFHAALNIRERCVASECGAVTRRQVSARGSRAKKAA